MLVPYIINTDLISIDNIQYSRPFQNDLGSEIPPSMQNKVKQIEFWKPHLPTSYVVQKYKWKCSFGVRNDAVFLWKTISHSSSILMHNRQHLIVEFYCRRTCKVLGPLQKLLLPFIFHSSVPLLNLIYVLPVKST